MSSYSIRALFWTPRALGIALAIFVSLFALDVFDEYSGFWPTLSALLIHLIPTAILVAALALAWRWEWIGAALFGAIGILVLVAARPASAKALFALPSFVIAGLFLINWIKRAELHA